MSLLLPDLGDWKNLNFPTGVEFRYKKYLNRKVQLERVWIYLSKYMPEYLSNFSLDTVVDFGSGNGGTLEIFRHFGYQTLAVDFYTCPEANYSPFLDSQGITLLQHDCRKFPYPLPDKSSDIVTSISSIDSMSAGKNFGRVINEFARIATHAIFVVVNKDSHQFKDDGGKEVLDNWRHSTFHRIKADCDNVYKWVSVKD